MMNALLMALSVGSAILYNSLKNIFSKKQLKNSSDNLAFNLIGNAAVVAVLFFAGGAAHVSRYTLAVAAGMGVSNLLGGLLFTICLASGPMALTSLLQLGISLVVSALLGPLFWDENISLWQAAGIVLMLLSMVLTTNTRTEKNITVKWLLLNIAGGVVCGTQGLFQKLLTTSSHAGEQMGFLFYSFILCTVFNLGWLMLSDRKEPVTCRMKGSVLANALVCGLLIAAMNIINLKLVAVLPTVVFFPVCTGLRILLTALADILLFKEKLSRRQFAGFAAGFAAMFLVAGIFG